jgi:phage antirepressor YoqD-like protein
MNKLVTYATAATRTVAAIIHATPIRRDADGRYCLNDLHRAAGAQKRHQPSDFLRLETTAELVTEISNSGDSRIKTVELSRGRYGGTYVVEDLALTYAMWISPRFHLEVLRGFKESRADRATDVGEAIMPAGTSLTTLLEMALDSERKRIELEKQIEAERPRVEFSKAVEADEGTRTIRETAKHFGMSDQQLTAFLIEKKVLYRVAHARGGQSQVLPYQRFITDEWFVVRTYAVATDHVRSRTQITGTGVMNIYRLLQQRAMH